MLARSLLTFSRTLVLSFLSSQATGKLHVYLDTQQGGKVATVSARDGLLKGSPTPEHSVPIAAGERQDPQASPPLASGTIEASGWGSS